MGGFACRWSAGAHFIRTDSGKMLPVLSALFVEAAVNWPVEKLEQLVSLWQLSQVYCW